MAKCPYCVANCGEYKQQKYTGQMLTLGRVRELAEKQVPANRQPEKYGFRLERPILLKNIPLAHRIPPPLHIKLGIGQVLLNELKDIIMKLGVSEDDIKRVLGSHGIDIKSYHGGALIGRHVTKRARKFYPIYLI